jgi:hypothetical protein
VDEVGVTLGLRDASTLDELGRCTAPTPVELGDVVALENGPLLRVVDALPVPEGWPFMPVLVEREPAFKVASDGQP